eukprot:71631_1
MSLEQFVLMQYPATGQYFYCPPDKSDANWRSDANWIWGTKDVNKADIWKIRQTTSRDNRSVFITNNKFNNMHLNYKDTLLSGAIKINHKRRTWKFGEICYLDKETTIYSVDAAQNMGYWKNHQNEFYVRSEYNQRNRHLAYFRLVDVVDTLVHMGCKR